MPLTDLLKKKFKMLPKKAPHETNYVPPEVQDESGNVAHEYYNFAEVRGSVVGSDNETGALALANGKSGDINKFPLSQDVTSPKSVFIPNGFSGMVRGIGAKSVLLDIPEFGLYHMNPKDVFQYKPSAKRESPTGKWTKQVEPSPILEKTKQGSTVVHFAKSAVVELNHEALEYKSSGPTLTLNSRRTLNISKQHSIVAHSRQLGTQSLVVTLKDTNGKEGTQNSSSTSSLPVGARLVGVETPESNNDDWGDFALSHKLKDATGREWTLSHNELGKLRKVSSIVVSFDKSARLVQQHNDKTSQKEWALISKSSGKVLKWFGISKPSKDAVAKEEARVNYFKHQGSVVVRHAELKDDKQAGETAVVVIRIPPELVKQWPQEVIKRNGSPHFTLSYLPGPHDAKAKQKLLELIRKVTADIAPHEIKLSEGVDWFTSQNPDEDAPEIAHKSVDEASAKWMQNLWQRLHDALGENGFNLSEYKNFIPHATLAYKTEREYDGPIPEGSFIAYEVEVWGWPKNYKIPFGGTKKAASSVIVRAMAIPTSLPKGCKVIENEGKSSAGDTRWKHWTIRDTQQGNTIAEISIKNRGDNQWSVTLVNTLESGYGAFLYETALQWVTSRSGTLEADQEVSDEAANVWNKYYDRKDVEKLPSMSTQPRVRTENITQSRSEPSLQHRYRLKSSSIIVTAQDNKSLKFRYEKVSSSNSKSGRKVFGSMSSARSGGLRNSCDQRSSTSIYSRRNRRMVEPGEQRSRNRGHFRFGGYKNLGSVRVRDLVRALHQNGFEHSHNKGDHQYFKNPDGRMTQIDTGNDPISKYDLKQILRQISWSEDLLLKSLGRKGASITVTAAGLIDVNELTDAIAHPLAEAVKEAIKGQQAATDLRPLTSQVIKLFDEKMGAIVQNAGWFPVRRFVEGRNVLSNEKAQRYFGAVRIYFDEVGTSTYFSVPSQLDTIGQVHIAILPLLFKAVKGLGTNIFAEVKTLLSHELRHAADWAYQTAGAGPFAFDRAKRTERNEGTEREKYFNEQTEIFSYAGNAAEHIWSAVGSQWREMGGDEIIKFVEKQNRQVMQHLRPENRKQFLQRIVKGLEQIQAANDKRTTSASIVVRADRAHAKMLLDNLPEASGEPGELRIPLKTTTNYRLPEGRRLDDWKRSGHGRLETVAIDDLITSQPTVEREVVRGFILESSNEPIAVAKQNDGRLVVVDGHHRLMARMLNGETTVNALVLPARTKSESLMVAAASMKKKKKRDKKIPKTPGSVNDGVPRNLGVGIEGPIGISAFTAVKAKPQWKEEGTPQGVTRHVGSIIVFASHRDFILRRTGYRTYTGEHDGHRVKIQHQWKVNKGTFPANQRQKREGAWDISIDGVPSGEARTFREARGLAYKACVRMRDGTRSDCGGMKTSSIVVRAQMKADELVELTAIAKQSATFEEFRKKIRQRHLTDLSSQDLRFGRAFKIWQNESQTTSVADLANGENSSYLTVIKYTYPNIYRAIIAPGDLISVYRAVPKEYAKQGIRVGDYVALERSYAELHAEGVLEGQQKERPVVISAQVQKKDVIWREADWSEWTYSPQPLRERVGTLEQFYNSIKTGKKASLIVPSWKSKVGALSKGLSISAATIETEDGAARLDSVRPGEKVEFKCDFVTNGNLVNDGEIGEVREVNLSGPKVHVLVTSHSSGNGNILTSKNVLSVPPEMLRIVRSASSEDIRFESLGLGTFIAKDVTGNEVARANVVDDGRGDYLTSVYVISNLRRQGVARKLYAYIEKTLGRKLKPSPTYQTPDAEAFWNSRRSGAPRTPTLMVSG